MDKIMYISYGAVSYTHLDVYKRQDASKAHMILPSTFQNENHTACHLDG